MTGTRVEDSALRATITGSEKIGLGGTVTKEHTTPDQLAAFSGSGATFNTTQLDQTGGTSDTYGVLAGLVNGSNTTYTVSQGEYATGTLSVYLNGQLLTQGSAEDWQETTPVSGVFDFTTAPPTGSQITAGYIVTTTTSSIINRAYRAITAAHTVTSTDSIINCTANTFTVTLPTAVGIPGREYDIRNTGNGLITLDGDGSETIFGALTQEIHNGENLTVSSDGANWDII